jgi:hypothetical protein
MCRSLLNTLTLACLLITAHPLMACSSCFSTGTGRMAEGANMAILSLYLVISILLCGFAGFFIYLWKKSRDYSLQGSNSEIMKGQ